VASDHLEDRGSARGKLLRFLVLPALLLACVVIWRFTPLGQALTAERVAVVVGNLQHSWWAPLVLVLSYIVLSPLVPATPLMIAGGVVFGAVYGSLYNLIGVYAGGIATYELGRFFGRDFVAQIGGRRLKKVERAIARRGFWGLVGVRFLPLPYAAINYCEALAGVHRGSFLLTTAVGITPPVILYSYFSAVLARLGSGEQQRVYQKMTVATLLLFALTAIPQFVEMRKRRQRYRELRAARAARAAS
jgi:phospholipase D1/2